MEQKLKEIYLEFDKKRKKHDAILADQNDIEELKKLEAQIKKKKS